MEEGSAIELSPGQTVRFSLPGAGVSKLAIIRYLTIPTAMLGTAVLASAALDSWTDLVAALGAAGGFLVGCAALKLYDSHAGRYWLDKVEFQHSPEPGIGDL